MSTHPTARPATRPSVPDQPEHRRWWHAIFPPTTSPLITAPPVPVAPVTVSYRQEAPQPVLVPARGDAFDFRLNPVFVWTAQHMTSEYLRLRAGSYLTWAGGILREEAVGLSRQHEPHRSHELEQALNTRLTGRRWPREGAAPSFTRSASRARRIFVRVGKDDPGVVGGTMRRNGSVRALSQHRRGMGDCQCEVRPMQLHASHCMTLQAPASTANLSA